MLRFGLTLLGLASVFGFAYEGFKIYDVTISTECQRELLVNLSKEEGYDLFNLPTIGGQQARIMVTPQKQKEFVKMMTEHELEYNVINANVARSFENDFNDTNSSISGALGTDRYYTHNEINNYLDYLANLYPKRVFVNVAGYSYENRTMKTITITNGDGRTDKKVIFIDGGIHAREWISPAAVVFLINQLVEEHLTNKNLLLDYDWIILPIANPDGYEFTQTSVSNRLWRKTRTPHKTPLEQICYGVDPNRNFDFHWGETGSSTFPCSDIYAGPMPFSEPETMLLRDLLLSVKDRCKFYLTLHSYGLYLIYPWGWISDLPDTWQDLHDVAMAGYDAIQNATGTKYTVGSSTNVLYAAAGASDDYAFGVANIPISITMELPKGGATGFNPPKSRIDAIVKETWIGIRAMALQVIKKY